MNVETLLGGSSRSCQMRFLALRENEKPGSSLPPSFLSGHEVTALNDTRVCRRVFSLVQIFSNAGASTTVATQSAPFVYLTLCRDTLISS